MYRACCCVLLAAWALSGQTTRGTAAPSPQTIDKLNSAMAALKTAKAPSDVLGRQLADSMMALAIGDRQPVPSDVEGFTSEFTRALAGRGFNNDQGAVLQQCLLDIVRGTGTSNLSVAQHLRETLTALRVDNPATDAVIKRFLAIGEAVRGPDDSPLRDKRIRGK